METFQFVNWYMDVIEYNLDLLDQDKIIRSIYPNGINNKYFKLFKHLTSNKEPNHKYQNFLFAKLIILGIVIWIIIKIGLNHV
jgi:hypothetical protein